MYNLHINDYTNNMLPKWIGNYKRQQNINISKAIHFEYQNSLKCTVDPCLTSKLLYLMCWPTKPNFPYFFPVCLTLSRRKPNFPYFFPGTLSLSLPLSHNSLSLSLSHNSHSLSLSLSQNKNSRTLGPATKQEANLSCITMAKLLNSKTDKVCQAFPYSHLSLSLYWWNMFANIEFLHI